MRNEIVRVWGKADNLALEYLRGDDGLWYANVPPDIKDGEYAAEIYAQNTCGATAFWTGILYMHSGRARLILKPQPYVLWLQPPAVELKFRGDCNC
ncbi:MAG: Ig-like domain-containing protein [Clostridia bacterium]|nr:Ig-like domain-containing protein [Clostridia bacterium]